MSVSFSPSTAIPGPAAVAQALAEEVADARLDVLAARYALTDGLVAPAEVARLARHADALEARLAALVGGGGQ